MCARLCKSRACLCVCVSYHLQTALHGMRCQEEVSSPGMLETDAAALDLMQHAGSWRNVLGRGQETQPLKMLSVFGRLVGGKVFIAPSEEDL